MEEKPTGDYKLSSSGDLAENKTQSIWQGWGQDVMYTYSVLALQASAFDCNGKQDSNVFRPLVQLTMIVTVFG